MHTQDLERLAAAGRYIIERASAVFGIKGSFLYDMLRPHPRFRALLAKMNLA